MRYLTFALFILGMIINFKSNAQVYFKAEYATASSFRDENNQKTGGKGGLLKVLSGFSHPLNYKQYDNGRIKMLAISLDVSYALFNNEDISTEIHPGKILNTSVSLSYLTPIGSKWSLLSVISGGVFSNPSKITAKSILGSGGVLFVYHLRDNLDVGMGVGITNSYGIPMTMPMGYINWQHNGKYEIQVNMLENMEISGAVKLNEWFKLRLIGFEMEGLSAVMNVNGKSKLFGMVTMKSGLQADFKTGERFSLQITGGGNWYRDAVLVNRKIKDYFRWFGREYDPSFQTAGYFSVGFKYGF